MSSELKFNPLTGDFTLITPVDSEQALGHRLANHGKTAGENRHIYGGGDAVDGDKLGIDFVPSGYVSTPDSVYSTDTHHLSSHLNGINAGLGKLFVRRFGYMVNKLSGGGSFETLTAGTINPAGSLAVYGAASANLPNAYLAATVTGNVLTEQFVDSDGNILNIVDIVDSSTQEPVEDASGRIIRGLFLVAHGVPGGNTASVETYIRFFVNAGGVITASELPGGDYNYSLSIQDMFYNLPRGAFTMPGGAAGTAIEDLYATRTEVRLPASAAMSAGIAVSVNSSGKVIPLDQTAASTQFSVIGVLANSPLGVDYSSRVITEGLLSLAVAGAIGSPVYVSGSSGALTTTIPVDGYIQSVGTKVSATHIFVDVRSSSFGVQANSGPNIIHRGCPLCVLSAGVTYDGTFENGYYDGQQVVLYCLPLDLVISSAIANVVMHGSFFTEYSGWIRFVWRASTSKWMEIGRGCYGVGGMSGRNAFDASGANTASGSHSFTSGGYVDKNTASGDNSAVLGGSNNFSDSSTSVVLGGTNNKAVGAGALVSGNGGYSYLPYERAHSSCYTSDWETQRSYRRFIACGSVGSGASGNLYISSSAITGRLLLPTNTTWAFNILVAGRYPSDGSKSCGFRFSGVIYRDAGNSSLIGSVEKTVLAKGDAAFDCDVTAGGATNDLIITATGIAAGATQWTAVVEVSHVLVTV